MLISCGEIRVSMLVFGCLVSCTPTPRKHFPSLGLFKTWGGFFFFQAQHLLFKAIAAVFASGSASRIAA